MPSKRKGHKKSRAAVNEPNVELPVFAQLLALVHPESGTRSLGSLIKEAACILGVPDLKSTRGLKHCHQSFDTISSTLDEVFIQSREYRVNVEQGHFLAAIVFAVYGQMADDALLRKRIFTETQFFEKATALLSSSGLAATELVIGALSQVTCIQDDITILFDVSRLTSAIIDCVETRRVSIGCIEDAASVVTRSTAAVLDHPNPKLAALAALPRVLRFSLSVVRRPDSTVETFNELLSFYWRLSENHAAVFLSIPDSIDFLIACTRSLDPSTRCIAQYSLNELYKERVTTRNESPERLRYDSEPPQARIQRALQRHPDPSGSFLMGTVQRYIEVVDLFTAFKSCSPQSHSQFGYALADLILRSEPCVRRHLHPGGPGPGTEQLNLMDMLRSCEAAVRSSGPNPRADVTADILHLELLLADELEHEKASAFARSSIERHPSVAFFYYAMTMRPDTAIASLLFAEKGLQCRSITDFLRLSLLSHVAINSCYLVAPMVEGYKAEVRFSEVQVMMEKASSSASAWFNIAPPDHPSAPLMSALTIHLDLMAKGHTLTDEELQTARKRHSTICEIARCRQATFSFPSDCLALDQIFARRSTAWQIWGPIISRQPSERYESEIAARTDVDPNTDFIAWLEKLDATPRASFLSEIRGSDLGTRRYGAARMYCCSACGTPSAALRRCAGCEKARYCNNTCQREHWEAHRKACKAMNSAEFGTEQ